MVGTTGRRVLMPLVVTLLLISPSDARGQGSAASEPAVLAVEVAPVAAPLTGVNELGVTVVIRNTGGKPLTDVSVTVTAPDGVRWDPDHADNRLTVAGGDSVIVRGALVGRARGAAATVVEAVGHSDGRTLVAMTTISHSAPPKLASLTIVGDSKLTNDDELRLAARLTNLGDAPIEATMFAVTTDHEGRIDEPKLERDVLSIAPGESGTATVTIAGDRLPTRDEIATITALVTSGAASEQLIEPYAFSTTPFNSENLLGTLGLVSLLLLPGVTALAAWSYVRSRWRRRRGVAANWIPDVKNLGTLVSVVVLSAASIAGFGALADENLYTGYDTETLLGAVAFGGVSGLVVGLLRWLTIWFWYPLVDEDTKPEKIFWALRQWSPGGATIDDKKGRALWVHDGAAAVVARVRLTSADSDLQDAATRKSLWRLKWRAFTTRPTFSFSPIAGEIDSGGITAAVDAGFRPTGKHDAIEHGVA